jgi:hypothetical protein
LPPEQVKELIEGMEKDVSTIKRNALTYSWYMRGGVSYEDILNMSGEEMDEISKIVESNLETTKKTQMPFF